MNIQTKAEELANSISSIANVKTGDEILAGDVVSITDDGKAIVAIDSDTNEVTAIPCGDFKVGDRVLCATNKSGNIYVINKVFAVSDNMTGTATISSESPKVGATIICNVYGIPSDSELGFQWYRPGEPVDGATSESYTITIDDLNSYVFCRVYDKSGKYSGIITSNETDEITAGDLVGKATLNITAPQPLDVLICSADNVQYNAVLGYQWYRGDTAIAGETTNKYKTTAIDDGYVLSCKVYDKSARYSGELIATAESAVEYEELTGTVEIPLDQYVPYVASRNSNIGLPTSSELYCSANIDQKDAEPYFKWYANGKLIAQTTFNDNAVSLGYGAMLQTITVEAADSSGRYKGSVSSDQSNIAGRFYGEVSLSKTDDIKVGDKITAIIDSPIDVNPSDVYVFWTIGGRNITKRVDGGDYARGQMEIEVPAKVGDVSTFGMSVACSINYYDGANWQEGRWPIYVIDNMRISTGFGGYYYHGISSDQSEPIKRDVVPLTGTVELSTMKPYIEQGTPITASVDTDEDTSEVMFLYSWHTVADDGTDTVVQESTSDSYELASTDLGKKVYCIVQDKDNEWFSGTLTSDETAPVFSVADGGQVVQNNGSETYAIHFNVIDPVLRLAEVGKEGAPWYNTGATTTAKTQSRLAVSIVDANGEYKSAISMRGNITIPEKVDIGGVDFTVVSIGDTAFNCNTSNSSTYSLWYVSAINLPSTITTIKRYAFYSCNSAAVIGPIDNVSTLERSCFGYCKGIKSTGIGSNNNLTSLPDYCFYYCTSITDTELSENDTIEILGYASFRGCSSIKSNGLKNNTTITSLGNYCFADCTSLTETSLGSSTSMINSVGDYCFQNCTSITTTGLGSNKKLTSLGDYCFSGCKSLQSTEVSSNGYLKTLSNYCFQNCTSLTSTGLGTNLNITSLGNNCFSGCTSLMYTGLSTNLHVTTLGNYCFSGCTKLEDTSLGGNQHVSDLGDYCFSDCTSLKETGLGRNKKITALGQYCFNKCTSLVDTGLGTNTTLTYINIAAFNGCTSLVDTGLATNTMASLAQNSFNGCKSLKKTGLEKNMSRSNVATSAFGNCTGLDELDFSESNIGYFNQSSFVGCTNVKSIVFSKNTNLTGGGYGAFAGDGMFGSKNGNLELVVFSSDINSTVFQYLTSNNYTNWFHNQPNIETVVYRKNKPDTTSPIIYGSSTPDIYYQVEWMDNGVVEYTAAVLAGTDLTTPPSTWTIYDGEVPPDDIAGDYTYVEHKSGKTVTTLDNYTYANVSTRAVVERMMNVQ